jgi:hypothetical protein
MGDGKAAEKERIPYNFDDVIGSKQKKKQGDHYADTPGLTGSDVKKARQSVCQRNVIHKSTVLLFYRNVNTTLLPFYGMPIDSLQLKQPPRSGPA